MKKHTIHLTAEQRQQLQEGIKKGKAAAREIMHAQVLLHIENGEQGPNWSDQQVHDAFGVSEATIWRLRRRFLQTGLDGALHRRPQPERPEKRKLNGEGEAHLIAVTCGEKPEGEGRWSLRLLAKTLVALGEVEDVSYETVRRTLNTTKLKPWLREQWCIPPRQNGEFVYHMEDVLRVYMRPYDPRFPLLCMDEISKQLLRDSHPSLPARPGNTEKYDYEYKREGVCNVFLACEPLAGKRYTKVTAQRTKADWAQYMRELIDVHYSKAEKIVLVMDNLNTHTPASFYEVFAPEEAERLCEKLEIHYTPKHGSWLNMAEIELAVLAGHPLKPRIGTQAQLEHEVRAWQDTRNAKTATVDWRFTTADARIKLKHLYPSIEG